MQLTPSRNRNPMMALPERLHPRLCSAICKRWAADWPQQACACRPRPRAGNAEGARSQVGLRPRCQLFWPGAAAACCLHDSDGPCFASRFESIGHMDLDGLSSGLHLLENQRLSAYRLDRPYLFQSGRVSQRSHFFSSWITTPSASVSTLCVAGRSAAGTVSTSCDSTAKLASCPVRSAPLSPSARSACAPPSV
jgi:hypothetical protein